MKGATKVKQLGIWMDHLKAHLIDNDESNPEHQHIESNIGGDVHNTFKGENHKHSKEQQVNLDYYKKIAERIVHFDHVLLFGPTDAKTELYNMLKKDTHFNDIFIVLESSDKMSENEKNAYVKHYFEKAILPIL